MTATSTGSGANSSPRRQEGSPARPVLPPWYVASVGALDACPCQWGPSGHCRANHHERCQRTWGWERHGKPDPETHIIDRHGAALTPVWRSGTACRWLCPCRCHTEFMALIPPVRREPGRPSRFGGNNRISGTDRLTAFDDELPTLFDEVTS